jgi:hypothetical protein
MNGQIEVKYKGNKVTVMGGPYLDKPTNIRGVKLAQEIDAPADVLLDVPDFGVPSLNALNVPIGKALDILEEDGVIYVGCMGGIGRTGMFIALLMKTIGVCEFNKQVNGFWGRVKRFFKIFPLRLETGCMVYDPVQYVREEYLSHAVETKQQEQLVQEYDPEPLLAHRGDF